MKFKFKISQTGNFYFFIWNLSEWHFSCRPEVNYYWKTFSPTKSFKEELLLEKYLKKSANIFKKYEKEKGEVVFPVLAKALKAKSKKDILNELKGRDRIFMEKVFKVFETMFSFYWQESKPRLKKFIQLFANPKVEKLIGKALKILEIYFGKIDSKEITVYLLMIPQHFMGGGGANVGRNKITVEIGNISPKGFRWSLITILHEIAHVCFQYHQSYFDNLLKEFLKSLNKQEIKEINIDKIFDNDLITIFREGITSSIISDGIIDDILFKTNTRKKLEFQLKNIDFIKTYPEGYFRKFMSYYLYPLNKKYLRQKRKIDKNYLKESLKLIKKFNKIYKKFNGYIRLYNFN
ncbi:MAG: hypothetical protein KatS3mg097_661 [Candidatus Parcubacteria bacterium]|nr:MAG: hypothetical protein KatS3mg097_661 [Candidatus Parcubacteria bacterium]